jgi:hypothetical protein
MTAATAPLVCARHFAAAFQMVGPSVSASEERVYLELRGRMRRVPLQDGAGAGGSGAGNV